MFSNINDKFNALINVPVNPVREAINRAEEAIKGPRLTAPPRINKWINDNRNMLVKHIKVCRDPVNSSAKKLLDIVSLGKFSEGLKKLNYDDVFHVYVYITLSNGSVKRIEKNAVVELTDQRDCIGEEAEEIYNAPVNHRVTLKDFFKNGEKFQKKFWSYDPKFNNCQNFASSLLISNKLIRQGGPEHTIIKQDSKSIFNNNPKYVKWLSKKITNLGGSIDVLLQGN